MERRTSPKSRPDSFFNAPIPIFMRTSMHQQVVTSDVLSIAKFVQACPQAFESATMHRPFLGYPVMTFYINIELRLLLEDFNTDVFTRLNPALFEQLFFNTDQMSLGSADQIINPSITHIFQHLLGWNAAIHKPGAAKFPILFFDMIQKFLQCCGISGISRIYLVGHGKTFRRQHQCHDHLNTIRTFVPAVS